MLPLIIYTHELHIYGLSQIVIIILAWFPIPLLHLRLCPIQKKYRNDFPSLTQVNPGADLLETLPYEATLEMETADFKDPDWIMHVLEFMHMSHPI